MGENKAIKLSEIASRTPKNEGAGRELPADGEEQGNKNEQAHERVSDCYLSALKILACSEKSEKQLYEKLLQKGFEREDINLAISKLKKERYLSDARFMEVFARHLAKSKLYGRARIITEIKLKFGKNSFELYYPDVEEALLEDIDFSELALSLAKKHKAKDKKYIFAKLKANGFAYDEIKYAFENLEGEE